MSKITVSETVSRSIAVDNSKADVQNAMIRCFQLLEERRFKEANVIIEQVLNIDPNNTDANVANFLVHYKLTSDEDIVNNFKSCVTYKNSLFYERVKRCAQNELSRKLHVCFGRASELLEQKRWFENFGGASSFTVYILGNYRYIEIKLSQTSGL